MPQVAVSALNLNKELTTAQSGHTTHIPPVTAQQVPILLHKLTCVIEQDTDGNPKHDPALEFYLGPDSITMRLSDGNLYVGETDQQLELPEAIKMVVQKFYPQVDVEKLMDPAGQDIPVELSTPKSQLADAFSAPVPLDEAIPAATSQPVEPAATTPAPQQTDAPIKGGRQVFWVVFAVFMLVWGVSMWLYTYLRYPLQPSAWVLTIISFVELFAAHFLHTYLKSKQ